MTKENDKLGSPFDESTVQGPQVSKTQYERVLSYIEEGRKSGAKLLYGGSKYGDKGYFLQPTVFADVSPPSQLNSNRTDPDRPPRT